MSDLSAATPILLPFLSKANQKAQKPVSPLPLPLFRFPPGLTRLASALRTSCSRENKRTKGTGKLWRGKQKGQVNCGGVTAVSHMVAGNVLVAVPKYHKGSGESPHIPYSVSVHGILDRSAKAEGTRPPGPPTHLFSCAGHRARKKLNGCPEGQQPFGLSGAIRYLYVPVNGYPIPFSIGGFFSFLLSDVLICQNAQRRVEQSRGVLGILV